MHSFARQLHDQKRFNERLGVYRAQSARCNAQMQLLEQSVNSILNSDPVSNYSSPFSSKYINTRSTPRFSTVVSQDLPQFSPKNSSQIKTPTTNRNKSNNISTSALNDIPTTSQEILSLQDSSQENLFESKDSLYVAAGSVDRFRNLSSSSDGADSYLTPKKYYIPNSINSEDEIDPGVSTKKHEDDEEEKLYEEEENMLEKDDLQNIINESSDSRQFDQKLQNIFNKVSPNLSKFSAVDTDSLSFGNEEEIDEQANMEEEYSEEIHNEEEETNQNQNISDKDNYFQNENLEEVDLNQNDEEDYEVEEDQEEDVAEELLKSDDSKEEEEVNSNADNDDLYFSFEEDGQSEKENLKI